MSNIIKPKSSSLRPTNGRQAVGDGAAFTFDTEPSVLAVCQLQGTSDMYYYSTTFSGGPGVVGLYSPDLATPPLTPDNPSPPSFSNNRQNDALDFLMTIFTNNNGLAALPYSQSVAISAPNLGAAFDGVVLSLPGAPKTLYVDGKSAHSVSIRESIRSSPALGNILHSLMYVGGSVVTKPPFPVDPAFVLVGLEI
ncbi:hypothetical protein C8F01DRAFT_1205977 [Mycena amicta]|nr:hypothetical protein C8F01DRAFT_1205977 [Mycena amicta]